VPRVDRDGRPLSPGEAGASPHPTAPVVLAGFPELGEVGAAPLGDGGAGPRGDVGAGPDDDDRPALAMAPAGIGALESVLHTLLAITDRRGPAGVVRIDAGAADRDSGVASELLATTATLGAAPVLDDTADGYDAVLSALGSAADWRYSPRWLLEGHDHRTDTAVLATARACLAGWADEGRSGVILFVYGGALHATDGLVGNPGVFHSYLLCAIRSADGTDGVGALHRVILSCPGGTCRRGGCRVADAVEATALLRPVMAAGELAEVASTHVDWAAAAYERLYGAEPSEGEPTVLDYAQALLAGAGWVELSRTGWEDGLEEVLLSRDQHYLAVAFDPATRQIRLADGSRALAAPPGTEHQGFGPVQATMLGLHPYGDATLRSVPSTILAEQQLTVLLHTAGLLVSPVPSA
jgi:hypothetical protein